MSLPPSSRVPLRASVVFFGYPFKKLAATVRSVVAQAIDAQIGVDVASIDVCIDGLVFPKE